MEGPLIAQAVEQLFTEMAWPDLDVLLVDLPPGTGDVHLTILERVAVSGAVIVTTPQRLATVDAERGIAMFHELDIPVFGIVENMAGYACPCCGEVQALFPGAPPPRWPPAGMWPIWARFQWIPRPKPRPMPAPRWFWPVPAVRLRARCGPLRNA